MTVQSSSVSQFPFAEVSAVAIRGAGTFDAVVVPSWRQILDVADWDASVGTHTVGQSGHPASEHFNDLFELWSTGRYHPLPYSRAAVEAAATSTMTLAP